MEDGQVTVEELERMLDGGAVSALSSEERERLIGWLAPRAGRHLTLAELYEESEGSCSAEQADEVELLRELVSFHRVRAEAMLELRRRLEGVTSASN